MSVEKSCGTGTDTAEALADLHARTNTLQIELARANAQIDGLTSRIDASVGQLTAALEDERVAREQDARRVALDGLRLQGLGIALVGLGGGVQVLALFLG